MNGDRRIIEDLRMELERLQSATHNIERLINEVEEQVNCEEPANFPRHRIIDIDIDRRGFINYTENHPILRDRHRTDILIQKPSNLQQNAMKGWKNIVTQRLLSKDTMRS